MPADELAPGKLIAQRYQLQRLLGEGGMGAVWSAMHVVTKKQVALKFLKPNAASSPSNVRRFLREARAASAVRHPNVVEIHDIVELEDGSPAMVMDLLLGESLAERLARQKPIALVELVQLLLPVISAVGTAHSLGIVHRDIKPDNIFLERLGDGSLVPRILDFGIAKLSAQEGAAAETATLTRTGSVMGTPYYMAPEQVFGESDTDQRADVWAFGVILYESLSGRRPIDGDNFGQLFKAIATGSITPLERVAPHLPADVTNLVARMLHKDRGQRPQDLREVFELLRRYTDAKVSSFASARPELLALHESGEAYAETLLPAVTPQQFVDGRSATALLSVAGAVTPAPTPDSALPAAARPSALSSNGDAFARTDSEQPRARSSLKWLGGAALVLAAAIGGVSLLSPTPPVALPDPRDPGQVKPPPAAAPQQLVAPPGPPPAVAAAQPLPVASLTPPSAPVSSATKRVTTRPQPPKPQPALTPTATPTATDAGKLPGGIAPQAPF